MIKKQLIMEKSLELFANQGFESTSIQQITEHCGISKGSFYLSFKSKDELILALMDHFMMQFISNIDYTVRETRNNEDLLHKFYYETFQSFHQHADFAKIFIKEQTQSFNKELIQKTMNFDQLVGTIILSMVERLYGENVQHTKHDLAHVIKGFIRTHSELLLIYNLELDLDLLTRSLVEKTNILAEHMTIPFISKDFLQQLQYPLCEEVTKEQMIEIIEERLKEMDDSIERESLQLLRQDIIEPVYSRAIVKGLLENIKNHSEYTWISMLLHKHYNF